MNELGNLQPEENLEGAEVRQEEVRELDEATHEPESHVEQTRDHAEAEVIETAFTELVDNAVEQGTGQVESAPLPLPPPGTQEMGGAAMASGQEEIEVLPIPNPRPADEISVMPIPTPHPADEISALPIPNPHPADEISGVPLPLPSPSDQEVVTAQMAAGEQQVRQDQMPGTHEGATDNRDKDGDRDEATPINLPGPETAQVNEGASPLPIPQPDDEISATPIPGPENPEQASRDDMGLKSELGEARLPEDGQMQEDIETGLGGIEDIENMVPGRGSLTDPEGNPREDGMDPLDLGSMLGEDIGFGSGGPDDLNHDSAAAEGKFETPPGIKGPFMPGKGPGGGMEADTPNVRAGEIYVNALIEQGSTKEELDAAEKELQEKAVDDWAIAYGTEEGPDGSDPPKPKDGSTSSTPEEGGTERVLPTNPDDRDHSSDQDQISLTTADDVPAGLSEGNLTEEGRKRLQEVKDLQQRLRDATYDDKREQVTDPPAPPDGDEGAAFSSTEVDALSGVFAQALLDDDFYAQLQASPEKALASYNLTAEQLSSLGEATESELYEIAAGMEVKLQEAGVNQDPSAGESASAVSLDDLGQKLQFQLQLANNIFSKTENMQSDIKKKLDDTRSDLTRNWKG